MRFRDVWNEYQDKEDLVKFEIVHMHDDLTVLGEAITSLLDMMERKCSKEVI